MQGYESAQRAAVQKPAAPPTHETGKPPVDVISPEELQFFATLYPEQSNEFSSSSTYSKNGVSPEHSVGSLIDKKS